MRTPLSSAWSTALSSSPCRSPKATGSCSSGATRRMPGGISLWFHRSDRWSRPGRPRRRPSTRSVATRRTSSTSPWVGTSRRDDRRGRAGCYVDLHPPRHGHRSGGCLEARVRATPRLSTVFGAFRHALMRSGMRCRIHFRPSPDSWKDPPRPGTRFGVPGRERPTARHASCLTGGGEARR